MESFVKLGEEKIRIEVQFGLLTQNLAGKGVTDINEIGGLEKLSNLEFLDLSFNEITEITELENLKI